IFLLITRYTSYEFSYDKYHERSDRIYRVYKKINTLEDLYLDAGTPGPLASTMMNEFPEVEIAARFSSWRNQLMSGNGKSFLEPSVFAVDPGVFKIFSLNLIHGDAENVLKQASDVAISEDVAMKYFGRMDVVGQILEFKNRTSLTISGVFETMPSNSHFKMDVLVNFDGSQSSSGQDLTNWNNNPFYTYVLLQEGTNASALEGKLPMIREKYANDPLDEDGQSTTYFLQPLSQVHFAKHINWSMGEVVDSQRLFAFVGIALAVLLMAIINYVNLATADATTRMKETGIRKIVGANRFNLLSQFLLESAMLVFLSVLVATLLAGFLLPAFAYFVNRPLEFHFVDSNFLLQLLLLGLAITILSGLYPALLMSSFNPLNALIKSTTSRNRAYLRNGLVTMQFSLSAILIVSAIVLQRQLSFVNTVDTGYARERIVILSTRDDAIDDNLPAYMQELESISGIDAVASSWSLPTKVTSNTQANWRGITEEERIQMYMLGVTYGFFGLYDIELKEGRLFNPLIRTDESAVILNESAVSVFGWKNPIGREMILQDGRTGTVIGVVKDFHIRSLREEIEPLQIVLNSEYARLAVRMAGDVEKTLAEVEKVYESFEPSYPFEYKYFEDIYSQAYEDDTKTGQMTLVFSMLAIIIACLGLFGLASHKVTERIKELGVRKVLGASSSTIAQLLFKDFLVLIVVAFVVAAPVAYFVLNSWLENYAYHIEIGAIPFVLTFLALIALAGITVGYRTFQASVTNPVNALRDE
ncbi:MAG: ABC transporter permease, partial [Bacteroidota bacterium]